MAEELGLDTIDIVIALEAIQEPVSIYTPIYNNGGDEIYLIDQIADDYETEEQKDPVKIDYENLEKMNIEVIESDLITTSEGTIRHNSMKLSSIIFSYLIQ